MQATWQKITWWKIQAVAHWPIFIAIIGFLILSVTSLKSGHHTLFNLEPYPDGLWYIGEAISFAKGRGLALTHQEISLPGKVPPMYSVVLSLLYTIDDSPELYYLTNCFLGILSLLALYQVVKNISTQKSVQFISLLLYLLHGYIFWILSVPMAENVGLTLFIFSLWGVTVPKLSPKTIFVTLVCLLGLLLTKYAYIGAVLALGLWLSVRIIKSRSRTNIFFLTSISVSVVLLLFLWFWSHQFNPFELFTIKNFGQKSPTSIQYYDFGYIPENSFFYAQSIAGLPTTLLWTHFALTSSLLFLSFGMGIAFAVQASKTRGTAIGLVVVLLALLPLFLLFYVADARYVLFSVPILVIGTSFLLETSAQNLKRHWFLIFTIGMVLGHVLWQLPIFKTIIATNWLQRSRAWQYEAVQLFNQTISTKPQDQQANTYVITALPPFLVYFYQTSPYQVLPLTPAQEFANKNLMAWGNIELNDLTLVYESLLHENKIVLVSGAYLTAQSEFQPAFEALKSTFNLELVTEGCLGTCNIYRLELITKNN